MNLLSNHRFRRNCYLHRIKTGLPAFQFPTINSHRTFCARLRCPAPVPPFPTRNLEFTPSTILALGHVILQAPNAALAKHLCQFALAGDMMKYRISATCCSSTYTHHQSGRTHQQSWYCMALLVSECLRWLHSCPATGEACRRALLSTRLFPVTLA